MSEAKKRPQMEPVTVRFSPNVMWALEQIAYDNCLSKAQAVRLATERVNQAVRGRRAENEKIAGRNRAEDAELEGRKPELEQEKYIWQDDLRERIKRAAAQATDEDSFAQTLRLDGMELLEQRQRDGDLCSSRYQGDAGVLCIRAGHRKVVHREGQRQGKYKGRQPVTVPDLPRHYERYASREISKAALARELGISRPTLDRLFAECREAE